MQLRELLWEYPTGIILFVRRLSLVFTIISGLALGLLLLLSVSGLLSSIQQRRIFNNMLHYGIVGKFEVINPLEVGPSDAEQMAAKLIYNSLVTIDDSGRMFPELAETWGISPDGREYTFFLKKGIKWHDGFEFTSKDVVTTFNLLRSGDTETVLGAIAKDVDVQIRGAYEVTFTLKQVNAAFLELMTIPLLPEHIYANISYSRLAELGESITPIGTGPYSYTKRVDDTVFLSANESYFKGVPSIKAIQISVFPNYNLAEKALLDGEVHVLSPIDLYHITRLENLESVSNRIVVRPFSQANNTRTLLFNLQKDSSPLLKDIQFRQAIAKTIERSSIVNKVTGAQVAYGPYDKSSFAYSSQVESINQFSTSDANGILEKMGWSYPYSGAPYRTKQEVELGVTITYLDAEINRTVVQELRSQLAKIGINVTLNGVSDDMMLQNILPKKEFELLLFEIHTGIDPDQYGLWHSSQTSFPGLNLSGYNSTVIDVLMEKGRLQTNRDKRLEIYTQFQTELVKDAVAIFLYRPAYYEAYFDIIDRKLPETIVDPSDRFSSIHTWKLMPGWRNWQTR